MISSRFHAVEVQAEARTVSSAPGPWGTGSGTKTVRGWSGCSSASTVHCILQVQRNGAAAKEVALRWSALTRPVAYASGASIVGRVSRSPERRHESRTAPVLQRSIARRNICQLSILHLSFLQKHRSLNDAISTTKNEIILQLQ